MPTRMVRPEELDAFFAANQNLLFIGKHGVGKTSKIKACFEKHGLIRNQTYLYFSASTLDPWVDLIGVPKETKDKNGLVSLDLVRPKALANGKVEAIFFDELNRSPKKVRNAVMELLQFKSINGMEFPNLRVIWAAINPDTEEDIYDVEKLDPAQKGRFQAWIDIPYECDRDYFVSKYGTGMALPALEWWNDLPEAVKNDVDPRRLDYALDALQKNLPLEFILPISSNINKLIQSIKIGPMEEKIQSLFNAKDTANAKLFLANANNFDAAMKFIIGDKKLMEFFLPLSPKERLNTMMSKDEKVLSFVTSNKNIRAFEDTMREILAADENHDLIKRIRRSLGGNIDPAKTAKIDPNVPPAPVYYNPARPASADHSFLQSLTFSTPIQRSASFGQIKNNMSQILSTSEAFDYLEKISKIIDNAFASHLHNFDKLTGLINNCIWNLYNQFVLIGDNLLADLIAQKPTLQSMFDKLGIAGMASEIMHSKPASPGCKDWVR